MKEITGREQKNCREGMKKYQAGNKKLLEGMKKGQAGMKKYQR